MTEVAFHGMNSGVQVGTSNAPINNTQVYLALGRYSSTVGLSKLIRLTILNPERLETQPSPLSTVPFRRDSDFVDRGALFDQIDEKTSETGSRIALVGLGGVG